MTNLKPCACGKVPEFLISSHHGSLVVISGSCGTDQCFWSIQIDSDDWGDRFDGWENKAWNAAPRPVTCGECRFSLPGRWQDYWLCTKPGTQTDGIEFEDGFGCTLGERKG